MTCELCTNKATRQRYVREAAGMILRWLCEACIAKSEAIQSVSTEKK